MKFEQIVTEEDYEMALKKMEDLWDAVPGTTEGDEFLKLSELIEDYEKVHHKIPPPEVIEDL